MSEHSQEPWAITADQTIEDATGEVVVLGLIDADFFFQSEELATEANIRRIVACVNACASIPTEWLEKYGRTAFVRKIVLVPDDTVGVVHEMLSKPLELSEKVVAVRTCDECGGLTTTTEADHE